MSMESFMYYTGVFFWGGAIGGVIGVIGGILSWKLWLRNK